MREGKMSKSLNILIIGGTGFIGQEVGIRLVENGHNVRLLSRTPKEKLSLSFPAEVYSWQPNQPIPQDALSSVDVIINLAGESISTGRWTSAKKKRIIDSRTSVVSAIAKAVESMDRAPVLIQASAIGFYGNRGREVLTESSETGSGFLAETTKLWEDAALTIEAKRKVIMRIGLVLGTTGGALPELINIYGSGLGLPLGSGTQYMSWIHIEDLCNFMINAIEDERYSGTFNLTAPNPVTNSEFHRAMTKYFFALPLMKAPSLAVKIALGEKSQLILDGQKVIPQRALDLGFSYEFTEIKEALSDLISSPHRNSFVLHRRQWIPEDIENTWQFFSAEKNLETITPPWLQFKVRKKDTDTIETGSHIDYDLKIHGIPVHWRSKILDFQPQKQFRDVQIKGPYQVWDHLHKFKKLGKGTLIEDYIRYKLPVGLVGNLFGLPIVQRDVKQIFNFRQNKLKELFKKAAS